MIYKGFLPFFDENSEILILGSFPSVISRETNFYYGNKQNRFWKILAEAFGEPAPETIGEKQALLKNHKIALWFTQKAWPVFSIKNSTNHTSTLLHKQAMTPTL